MPAPGPRKRGAATSATANSPGQKRLKTEVDARAPDTLQQNHIHPSQQGHQLPPPQQQFHHTQHYGSGQHAGSGGIYDHNQAVSSGNGMGAMDSASSAGFPSHYSQQPVNNYRQPNYNTTPVAPATAMSTPTMNGTIHSPYPPQTPMQAPATTPQPKQTPNSGGSNTDLPPNPRIRTDGKGRDPYNIETICKQLKISTTVWDQKLRVELTKVIEKHGLAGQKVIPTNITQREQAVDEWIRNCPEWLNEENEKYRKIYAMDRLKCGMADIRRTQNQRIKKNQQRSGEANGVADEVEEKQEELSPPSPEQMTGHQRASAIPQESPAPLQPAVQPAAAMPIFTPEQRTITGTGPINTFAPTASPSQNLGGSIQIPQSSGGAIPAAYIPYSNTPIEPSSICLTVSFNMSDTSANFSSSDFMPKGVYSWEALLQCLREDLQFSSVHHRLYYDGFHGRVFVNNDRTLRNGIAFEAGRGTRYPKWEIERHP